MKKSQLHPYVKSFLGIAANWSGHSGSVSKEVKEINPDTLLNLWHFYLYFIGVVGTVFRSPSLALLYSLMPDNLNYDHRETLCRSRLGFYCCFRNAVTYRDGGRRFQRGKRKLKNLVYFLNTATIKRICSIRICDMDAMRWNFML